MKVKIYPSKVSGAVKIPPSKSMSHRAIICASLAKGKSIISNIAYSEDVTTTIDAMRVLGAKIECFDDYIEVYGIESFENVSSNDVHCNESGSTLRFLIPIFSLTNKEVNFHGKNRLLIRPQDIYKEIFEERKLFFTQNEKVLTINGSLTSGTYSLRGDVSSQFISGLLFTLPMLLGDSRIIIDEPYESRSYVDLTLQMLKDFGIDVTYTSKNELYIKGSQSYKPQNHTVEGDFSQFGFFGVLGAINSEIDCLGLRHDSLQGDKEAVSILEDFGADITEIDGGYKVKKSNLTATKINLENCPDLGPILTVMCANSDGKSNIFNAGRLRIKESDRILAMETELKKFEVLLSSTNDEVFIEKKAIFDTSEELFSHKDHRIVMALSVLATICEKPVVIESAEYIKKSYPHFFEDLQSLGIKIDIIK